MGQLSSCFLLTMKEDSIEGIFDTLKRCALISKTGGGISLSVSRIRSTGSLIARTNGQSTGVVPMLRIFNQTASYIDQGGKRPGSIAVYLEPWHSDIFDFLDLKKNTGKEERRARELFYALWIPDLFMRRVEADASWTLFCPNECPELERHWGAEFDKLYEQYEQAGRGRRSVNARQLWFAVLESQIETGTPYMLYKDHCNAKSNQQHLGTIRSSNLCAEIVEYTAEDEVAVCNLASLALPRFVDAAACTFDFQKLYEVTAVVATNLDKIIDNTRYPLPEAQNSNLRHRPMGIGVQGLADVFMLLRMAFDSPEAAALNREIAETIYFAALSVSIERAKQLGPHPSYAGSPLSRGLLQPDMWHADLSSSRWNWVELRKKLAAHGARNSLLVALMPTASTSQILGHNECIEPYTSNIYSRRVLSGEFVVVNRHLMRDLIQLGLWSTSMKQRIIQADGSVQQINEIPAQVRALYKTAWELKQRVLVDLATGRAPFVDQSQSLNIFMAQPDFARLTSLHFYTWKHGLKTGMYYLRTQPAARAVRFTVPVNVSVVTSASTSASASASATAAAVEAADVCKPGCTSCSA